VVEEAESATGETHKILEYLYIKTNPVIEPLLSGETSPVAYNVLFKDMEVEEGNENNEIETF
jgi:hypothetical protein